MLNYFLHILMACMVQDLQARSNRIDKSAAASIRVLCILPYLSLGLVILQSHHWKFLACLTFRHLFDNIYTLFSIMG